jgi:phenylalanyl-tRNA synthetase beta chain
MKVPLSWLRQYIEIDISPQDLAHRLTMAGTEVGKVEEIGAWKEIFVGHVKGVRPHPNADRLRLCTVTTGTDEMEVVCGAPNVDEGQNICFARVGAYLYNAHSGKHEVLAAAKIRGVESQGMICSALELGLGEDHSGIIVLPGDAPVGMPLTEYMGDTILGLELTPNRLDCLSMLGVAREVAALTGGKVTEPAVNYDESGKPIADRVSISIADPDLCERYTASLVQGVKIGPSPKWLQDRLTSAGLRPINNVVDATNFVMLEYNQPLHAFDFDLIKNATVIVRRANSAETLKTLDGVERKLGPENLVIADANDPIGIAGVIGGANSEISDGTTTVLLESATFNGLNNRETAQTMDLRTEATLRFEKGLRAELAPIALRRATGLIQEVAGGAVAPGIVDVFPGAEAQPPTVPLTATRLRQVLGMDVDLDTVKRVLDSLGFSWESTGNDSLTVSVPYWRADIGIEEDLVEEVVRIVGYDAVPTTTLSTPIPFQTPPPQPALRDRVRDLLAASGMQEVINYPLVTLQDLEQVEQLDQQHLPMAVANPMSAAHQYLRPTLQASLMATLAANQGHSAGPFRLFESGRVFHPREGDLPNEVEMVAGLLAGRRHETSWLADDSRLDFYDAKGVLDWVFTRLGVEAAYEPGNHPTFYPGRCAVVRSGGADLGFVGEVHPTVRERLGLDFDTVAAFEIDLGRLLSVLPVSQRQFAPLSRFPAASRDLALVVPAEVPAGRVSEIIHRHRLVAGSELFDIYAGDNIVEGAKSLAFHVYFQARDRTLTNDEVSRSLDGLLRTLEREVNASLRS